MQFHGKDERSSLNRWRMSYWNITVSWHHPWALHAPSYLVFIWYIILSPPSKDRVEWGQRCPSHIASQKALVKPEIPQLCLPSTLWGPNLLSITVDFRDQQGHYLPVKSRTIFETDQEGSWTMKASKPSPQMCGVQLTGSESCSYHFCLCHLESPSLLMQGVSQGHMKWWQRSNEMICLSSQGMVI